jgi:hypothetical protein
LLVTTNKTQNWIRDRKFGRVKFLILSRRLAGGKNITEESLCFSSYVGSYGRWLGQQFWEVVGVIPQHSARQEMKWQNNINNFFVFVSDRFRSGLAENLGQIRFS